MGNPNARPKKPSGGSQGRRSWNDSAVLPKTIPQNCGKVVPAEASPAKPCGASNEDKIASQVEDDAKKVELRFKSAENGAVITPKFKHEAHCSSTAQPIPSYKLKELFEKSPSFTPLSAQSNQSQQNEGTGNTRTSSPQKYPVAQKLKTLVCAIPQPTNIPNLNFAQDSRNRATPNPGGVMTSTALVIPLPQAPRTFLTRADKTKKDIVITSSSIIHNLMRITERYLPNGLPYHTTHGGEFNTGDYDIVGTISKMEEEKKKEFWGGNWVEIVFDLQDEVQFFTAVEGNRRGKELVNMDKSVLESIDKLGPDFTAYTKTVFVTIQFPDLHAAGATQNETTAFTNSKTPNSRDIIETPAFKVIENLARKLDNFTAIQKMEVILRTPSSKEHLVSLHQICHLLPLYDMKYEDWQIRFQANYMTRSVPVLGFSIAWLDGERQKVLYDREKKITDAVFVRKSVAPKINLRESS